ncbi:hypothetical protein GCM10010885_06660 [Alicyclobacillus cellulosilyticus]|uniref:Purine catabolism regulator n=1 Tax=Alicyclobacillus cellulosilyticus TaxID=1003997 RepID=A0A917NGS8_9BACL|nr:PucR family transcriptional regulator [Alicyclobacillus cellulosilyticus]GGJ00063.1 hypothetical protein GCM10010885_06660 [Alicyclobacillus cellulosilyticus]
MRFHAESLTPARQHQPLREGDPAPSCGLLRVRDVLERPLFAQARVIAGEHGLDRLVRWVHILDVADARALIHGGELVLSTGAGVGQSEEKFLQYVRQLIEGRASGLCVELGTVLADIPASVRHLAEQHHFPLIVFPVQVRFVDITQDLHKLIFLQERQMLSEQDWLERLILGDEEGEAWFGAGMRLKPDRRYRIAVLRLTQGKNQQDLPEAWVDRKTELASILRESFQHQRLRVFLSIRLDSSIALLEMDGTPAQWRPRMQAAMQDLRHALRNHGFPDALHVGVGQEAAGRAGGTHRIRDSYRTAVAASSFAQLCGQDMMFYEDAGVYRWIAPLARHDDILALAQAELAAVMEYDRQNHTQLLHTLKVYLDCDRSKQQTADRLYIHRQTLYHRLLQIERLLRANLDDPVQRLSVHLAVYAYLYHQQREERGGV